MPMNLKKNTQHSVKNAECFSTKPTKLKNKFQFQISMAITIFNCQLMTDIEC